MKTAKDNLKAIARWSFGIIMGITGLALLTSSVLGSFAAFVLGALAIPPLSKAIFSKLDFKFKAGTAILSLFVLASQMPQDIEQIEPTINPEPNQTIELQSEALGAQAAPILKEILQANETPEPEPVRIEESEPIQEPASAPLPEPEPLPEPTPPPEPPAPEPVQVQDTGPNYSCYPSKTCGQMTSCEEAYFYLNVCGDSARDGDGDGVPCESICL